MSDPIKHHYVPRFILRRFTNSAHDQRIWTYDKQKGARFAQNIINAAQENNFYEVSTDTHVISAEKTLAAGEGEWSAAFDTLIRSRCLRSLSTPEFQSLSTFLSVQWVRTRAYRERFRNLAIDMRAEIVKRGFKMNPAIEAQLQAPTEDDLKIHTIRSLADFKRLKPYFEDKIWLLYETNTGDPLFISDSPLVMDNQLDHWPRGNLGLGAKGIEIYFPLTTTLCLALYCPSIISQLEQAVVKTEIAARFDHSGKILDGRNFLERAKKGVPIDLDASNVERLNSLQVIHSHRFVYCENDSFTLIDRMLDTNPSFKTGKKVMVGDVRSPAKRQF